MNNQLICSDGKMWDGVSPLYVVVPDGMAIFEFSSHRVAFESDKAVTQDKDTGVTVTQYKYRELVLGEPIFTPFFIVGEKNTNNYVVYNTNDRVDGLFYYKNDIGCSMSLDWAKQQLIEQCTPALALKREKIQRKITSKYQQLKELDEFITRFTSGQFEVIKDLRTR